LAGICPEKIIRTAAPRDGGIPSKIPLLPSPRVANLKWITCNVLEPVLLRLLACKDENGGGMSDNCPYPEHKNISADTWTCSDSNGNLAQIYIRHDSINQKSRSCVIAFVEGQCLHKTGELLELLQNTITWLGIKHERPYFYIFYYGHPMNLLTANNSRHAINKKIKEIFDIYSPDEDVCITVPVRSDSECLIINHTKKFSFSAA
jgi:hypothetical protein